MDNKYGIKCDKIKFFQFAAEKINKKKTHTIWVLRVTKRSWLTLFLCLLRFLFYFWQFTSSHLPFDTVSMNECVGRCILLHRCIGAVCVWMGVHECACGSVSLFNRWAHEPDVLPFFFEGKSKHENSNGLKSFLFYSKILMVFFLCSAQFVPVCSFSQWIQHTFFWLFIYLFSFTLFTVFAILYLIWYSYVKLTQFGQHSNI